MSGHLSDDVVVGLLHGTLDEAARAEAKRHLGACPGCAELLAREAAVDEVLWEARRLAPPPPAVAKRRRRLPIAWMVGAAATAGLAYVGVGAAGQISTSGRDDMGNPLAWYNVIFYIPLVVGVLLVLGSAFAGHGHDAGHDHDADHGHDGDGHGLLSLLGVGRVPLTVGLMIAAFLFGGIGVIVNLTLAAAGLSPGVYGPIALGSAVVYTLLLTRPAAGLIQRIMPTTETYPITHQDFAGCTGTLLLPADPTTGYAQVKDPEGNVHNIKCRTARGALAKGTSILIVEYDEDTKSYVVDANPVATQ